ncbi:hypothetical protein [Paenibacillus sp. Soil522]|uniref:hypothetical protein n=1 Tax=Paenibacillus sp. Soil522 TaxID=1736388 RepID=UPI000A7CE25E|nr:hypothetical protein [Paenibacillus sp. Soil522]
MRNEPFQVVQEETQEQFVLYVSGELDLSPAIQRLFDMTGISRYLTEGTEAQA